MDLLKEFESIGKWELNDQYSSNKSLAEMELPGIGFEIEPRSKNFADVIYIFKTREKIIYVGETSRKLAERLASYRFGFDKLKDTDNRVKIALTEFLQRGESVEILCWQPRTFYTIGEDQIEISASKPLEDYLIKKLSQQYELVNLRGAASPLLTEKEIRTVFSVQPHTWGLRGDPYFWDLLKEWMLQPQREVSAANFERVLSEGIATLINEKGIRQQNEQVQLADIPDGGMSGGFIDLGWWEREGKQHLLKNVLALKTQELNGV